MKVIQNNYENPIVEEENINIICEECNSVFEIEKEDCHMRQRLELRLTFHGVGRDKRICGEGRL